ncbi:MAG: CopG family transcriptional regulator [Candidatus Njordarchaeales archaeon]
MSKIISVRVPDDIKREMDKFRDVVNWSEEIRKFIIKRIKELKEQKETETVVNPLLGNTSKEVIRSL